MDERKRKTIYCPGCGRKGFTIHEGCGMVIQKKCEKCNKLIDYNPRYGVRLLDIPRPHCSSGKRFY